MVVFAAALALSGDVFDPSQGPRKAVTWIYQIEVKGVTDAGTDEMRTQRRVRVSAVHPDGSCQVLSRSLGGYSIVGGQRVELKPATTDRVIAYGPTGRAIPPEQPVVDTDPFSRVLTSVTWLELPDRAVKVGARFGAVLNSNHGFGTNDATLVYDVLRAERWEGQDALRIRFSYREKRTPVVFDGFWIVRTSDGAALAMRATGENVTVRRDAPPNRVTIAMTLLSERPYKEG